MEAIPSLIAIRDPRKAENTQLLADKKPQHDPQRYRACHFSKGDISQIDPGIDKGKKGQNEKSHPVVQPVLHLMRHREALALRISGVHRDEKCQRHTCKGSMYTGLEYRDPEYHTDDDIGCLFGDVETIHYKEQRQSGSSDTHGCDGEFAGIEECDDHDSTEIIDDRQCHQEDLQRDRHSASK